MHRKPKRETKSPIKDLPVRNPGQGLDEEIDRLLNDRALGYILAMVMLAFLAVWEWWRVVFPTQPHPILMTVLALLVWGFSIRKLIALRRQLRNLSLARKGERAVGQFLEEHARPLGYQVLHDVVGDGFNVDHVLVGPGGVFAVETKTASKPSKGMSRITYDGDRITVDGFSPDRDPIVQAKACAAWIGGLIKDSAGKQIRPRPVVLYPGWYVEHMPKGCEVWVMNEKVLISFLKDPHGPMPDDEVSLISYHLKRYVIAKEREATG